MADKPKFYLDDFETALEMSQDYMFSSYANKKTGEVVPVSEEDSDIMDGGEDRDESRLPEWQREARAQARQIAEHPEDYAHLPVKYDFDEYRVMQKFCQRVDDEKVSEELWDAISGRGAFRNFKSVLHRRKIVDDWHNFRYEAMKKFAQEWCDENGFELLEGLRPR